MLIGGKKKSSKWDKKVKQREKELSSMKNTKSYISINKLSDQRREYFTHDNGGRPFRVSINKSNINIYKFNTIYPEIYKERILCIKKFIGYWYGFDSSPNPSHGNSLLVKISDHKYIHIGYEIYEFYIDDIINEYVSPIGNNDVPYPIAYGSENAYFMLDKMYIKNVDLDTPLSIAKSGELYGEFYGHIGAKKGTHQKYDINKIKILSK